MLQTCMSDSAWFLARIDQICIITDIADAVRIIYDGLVVDGYEFGHGIVSQTNSNIVLPMGLMWENI